MGLDNGVSARINLDKLGFYQALPEEMLRIAEHVWFEKSKEEASTLRIEFIYWRKWWGCRNEVMVQFDAAREQYYTPLTLDKIDTIIEVLKYFDNEDIWDYQGESIWEYKEDGIHDQIQVDIFVLEQLKDIMKNDYYYKQLVDRGAIEIYFYDSY